MNWTYVSSKHLKGRRMDITKANRQLVIINYIMKYLLLFSLSVCIISLDNGVGLTPPMGWNSWNHFGCNISQSLIKQTADLLVSTGLSAKGYKYLNLDDCWQASRNPNTNQIIADNNFPSGIQALSKYVHSKGLLFGLYSDAGSATCQGRPGSYGFQNIDAQTYAKWEVDYLKYDNCNNNNVSAKVRYPVMRDALNKTNRKIFYSMCNWGEEAPATWAAPVANSWRTTGDIEDKWGSFLNILDQQVELEKYAGPGAWNDPDMLEVGNGGMTLDQYQAHFAIWAVLKAPLLIGCDLSKLTPEILKILGNQQLIAINQDKLGIQASRIKREIYSSEARDYYAGRISGERYVVVLFNRQSIPADFTLSLVNDLKLDKGLYVTIRDVIAHQDLGIFHSDTLIFKNVNSHSVRALTISLIPAISAE